MEHGLIFLGYSIAILSTRCIIRLCGLLYLRTMFVCASCEDVTRMVSQQLFESENCIGYYAGIQMTDVWSYNLTNKKRHQGLLLEDCYV